MIVKDNLLHSKTLVEFEQKILNIPFYFTKVLNEHSDCFLNTPYYSHKIEDEIFYFLHNIFNCPLNVVSWWRMRINVTFKNQESKLFGWHTDWGTEMYNPQFEYMKTAVFYLSDTNGPTVFKESNDKVNCVKNRVLIFNSCVEHSGTSHTSGDTKRIVLNMNYF